MATAQPSKRRCEHRTLKLEPSGCASFTGNFYCMDCGDSIVPAKPIIALRPRVPVQRVREAERTR